jgi:hypothetical protein
MMHASVQPRRRCATPSDCTETRRHDPLPADHSRKGANLFATVKCQSTSFTGVHHADGEVGTNQLDAARQAVRSEAAARERTQRLLEEEQATIRDLQTKLGHERLAKDEALETVRQLETETRVFAHNQETAEVELAAERLARHNAEVALAEALEAGMEADGRLRQVIAASRFRGRLSCRLDRQVQPGLHRRCRPPSPRKRHLTRTTRLVRRFRLRSGSAG